MGDEEAEPAVAFVPARRRSQLLLTSTWGQPAEQEAPMSPSPRVGAHGGWMGRITTYC